MKIRFSDSQVSELRAIFGRASADSSVSAATTHAMREAILRGILSAEAALPEEGLCEALRVSRTPVRQALRRLEAEGLGVRRNGQVVVSPVDPEDVAVIYSLQQSLEGLAARMATVRAGRGLAERLTEVNRRVNDASRAGRTEEALEMNLTFHREICAAAGSRYVKHFSGQLEQVVRRLRAAQVDNPHIPDAIQCAVDEHDWIVAAIRAGDAAGADQAMTEHLGSARARIVAGLRERALALLGSVD
jgi:DNA-binding GntR family transcriptional regulator